MDAAITGFRDLDERNAAFDAVERVFELSDAVLSPGLLGLVVLHHRNFLKKQHTYHESIRFALTEADITEKKDRTLYARALYYYFRKLRSLKGTGRPKHAARAISKRSKPEIYTDPQTGQIAFRI